MKLMDEKVDVQHFFSVGYDDVSGSYILSVVIAYVSWFNRYFKITEEEYTWFDKDHERLVAFMQECYDKNIHHPRFFFSEFDADNTEEQEKIKWNYFRQNTVK